MFFFNVYNSVCARYKACSPVSNYLVDEKVDYRDCCAHLVLLDYKHYCSFDQNSKFPKIINKKCKKKNKNKSAKFLHYQDQNKTEILNFCCLRIIPVARQPSQTQYPTFPPEAKYSWMPNCVSNMADSCLRLVETAPLQHVKLYLDAKMIKRLHSPTFSNWFYNDKEWHASIVK